jgi:hypothetical protein
MAEPDDPHVKASAAAGLAQPPTACSAVADLRILAQEFAVSDGRQSLHASVRRVRARGSVRPRPLRVGLAVGGRRPGDLKGDQTG